LPAKKNLCFLLLLLWLNIIIELQNTHIYLKPTPFRHTTRPALNKSEIAFGTQSVLESLRAGKEIDKIIVQRELGMAEIEKLANEREIPVQRVPLEKLNQINYVQLSNIVADTFEKGEIPLLLILDRITDVRNFGAIARTAECMGVHALVVPVRGGAQINSDALKTSSGALNYMPVCREQNLITTIRTLQDSGIQVVACTEKATDSVFSADYKVPTAIIVGSEEDGVSPDLLRRVDAVVKISMLGNVASLNVSVATGMILSEVQRQRL
jgi:23S rRNA (guanosine2251-2'-O)-methyltransferase